MDNNRAAIMKELVVIIVVVALLAAAAGFLIRNVVVAVRSLDGMETSADFNFSLDVGDFEKAFRDLAAKYLPAESKKTPAAPAPPAAAPQPAAPAGQAKQPAAENKKGEVTTVRFFEAGKDVPQPQARRYAVQFSRQARNIYFEIAYKNNGFRVADAIIPLEIRCIDTAGQTVAELKTAAKPKKEWATAVYTNVLGPPATGAWSSGQYTVKVFFDGDPIGDYKFTIE